MKSAAAATGSASSSAARLAGAGRSPTASSPLRASIRPRRSSTPGDVGRRPALALDLVQDRGGRVAPARSRAPPRPRPAAGAPLGWSALRPPRAGTTRSWRPHRRAGATSDGQPFDRGGELLVRLGRGRRAGGRPAPTRAPARRMPAASASCARRRSAAVADAYTAMRISGWRNAEPARATWTRPACSAGGEGLVASPAPRGPGRSRAASFGPGSRAGAAPSGSVPGSASSMRGVGLLERRAAGLEPASSSGRARAARAGSRPRRARRLERRPARARALEQVARLAGGERPERDRRDPGRRRSCGWRSAARSGRRRCAGRRSRSPRPRPRRASGRRRRARAAAAAGGARRAG